MNARELALSEEAVFTIGSIHGGTAANVIPDTLEMSGSIRTYDEDVRSFLKKRMTEISQGIASAFRAFAEVSFSSGCPTLINDSSLSEATVHYVKELLGSTKAFTTKQLISMSGTQKVSKTAGSEDFAYVSHEVPSIMLALAAGTPEQGYIYSQHHPKTKFDESALSVGSAVYAYTAMRWLGEHR